MFKRQQHLSQQTGTVSLVALTPSLVDPAKVWHGGSFHDATVEDVKRFVKNFARHFRVVDGEVPFLNQIMRKRHTIFTPFFPSVFFHFWRLIPRTN